MPHREDNGRAGQSEGPAGSAQPRPGSCPRVCDGGGGAQVETLQDGVIGSLEDLVEGDHLEVTLDWVKQVWNLMKREK